MLKRYDMRLSEHPEFDKVLEPIDPGYINGYKFKVPSLGNEAWIRKVSILQNKLRRHHIRYEWEADSEMFRVWKYRTRNGVEDEYPTVMWVGVYDTGEYCFGGEEEDMIVSRRVSDVVNVVEEWLNNNKPGMR